MTPAGLTSEGRTRANYVADTLPLTSEITGLFPPSDAWVTPKSDLRNFSKLSALLLFRSAVGDRNILDPADSGALVAGGDLRDASGGSRRRLFSARLVGLRLHL